MIHLLWIVDAFVTIHTSILSLSWQILSLLLPHLQHLKELLLLKLLLMVNACPVVGMAVLEFEVLMLEIQLML